MLELKLVLFFILNIFLVIGQDTREQYCNIAPACITEGITYRSETAVGKTMERYCSANLIKT